eukprot:Em0013g751a
MLTLLVKSANDLKAFSNLGWALLRTFVATTGDTNFDGIFIDTPLLYSSAAIFLFPIFLISITVLFNNMLVGLAVGEVGSALKDAKIIGLACQAEFIIRMEDAFPFLRAIIAKKQHCICAQNYRKVFCQVLHFFKCGDDDDDDVDDITAPNLDEGNDLCDGDKGTIQTSKVESELKEQIEATKQQLMEVQKQSIVKQDAMRTGCEAMQKQLAELQKQNDVMQEQLNTLLAHFGLHQT